MSVLSVGLAEDHAYRGPAAIRSTPASRACLGFYKTERPVCTASAVEVRQHIYRTRIGWWRHYKHLLGPLIEALQAEQVVCFQGQGEAQRTASH